MVLHLSKSKESYSNHCYLLSLHPVLDIQFSQQIEKGL